MSTVTRPQGPLPTRIYWIRRAIVLSVPVVLVTALTLWLVGGSDGKGDDADKPVAKQAAAKTTPLPTETPTTTTGKRKKKHTPPPSPTAPAPPQPTGPCAAADVKVVPSVPSPIGGSDVLIGLALSTKTSAPCTWSVSAESLTLKISSGSDDIWSSADCPTAIPVGDVVLSNEAPTPISVTWAGGRRSDEVCSVLTDWAMPGFYHVKASALGGNPKDVQFELVAPQPAVVTSTIPPEATPGATDGPTTESNTAPTQGGPAEGQPTDNGETPSGEPSGAVEPTG